MKTKKIFFILLLPFYLNCSDAELYNQPKMLEPAIEAQILNANEQSQAATNDAEESDISDLDDIADLPLDQDENANQTNILTSIKQEIPEITDSQAANIYSKLFEDASNDTTVCIEEENDHPNVRQDLDIIQKRIGLSEESAKRFYFNLLKIHFSNSNEAVEFYNSTNVALNIIKEQAPNIIDSRAEELYFNLLTIFHADCKESQELARSIEIYAQKPTKKNEELLVKTMSKSEKNPYIKKALNAIFTIILGGGGAYAYNKINSHRFTRAIDIEGITSPSSGFDWFGLLKTGGIVAAGITVVVVLVSIWVKIKRFIFGDSVNELKNAHEYNKKVVESLSQFHERIQGLEENQTLLEQKVEEIDSKLKESQTLTLKLEKSSEDIVNQGETILKNSARISTFQEIMDTNLTRRFKEIKEKEDQLEQQLSSLKSCCAALSDKAEVISNVGVGDKLTRFIQRAKVKVAQIPADTPDESLTHKQRLRRAAASRFDLLNNK